MSKDNIQTLDFWVLNNQIETYLRIVDPRAFSSGGRGRKYILEQELTQLDFIQDELRELLRDAKSRAEYLAERLDNEV